MHVTYYLQLVQIFISNLDHQALLYILMALLYVPWAKMNYHYHFQMNILDLMKLHYVMIYLQYVIHHMIYLVQVYDHHRSNSDHQNLYNLHKYYFHLFHLNQ